MWLSVMPKTWHDTEVVLTGRLKAFMPNFSDLLSLSETVMKFYPQMLVVSLKISYSTFLT